MNPKKILNPFVPTTRFNRGEASKIINEVKHDGVKFIIKNNIPECVLLSTGDYKKLLDDLEDAEPPASALERKTRQENRIRPADFIPQCRTTSPSSFFRFSCRKPPLVQHRPR